MQKNCAPFLHRYDGWCIWFHGPDVHISMNMGKNVIHPLVDESMDKVADGADMEYAFLKLCHSSFRITCPTRVCQRGSQTVHFLWL
mgnify:FL=1